jgi:shikimate kinase
LSVSNVFFVGLMGAGKTTVGRAVARRLDLPFFDSDHEIEARCGVRVPVIFEHEGETGFRDRETHVIDELTTPLRANPHDLYLRTRHDKNRPLLQTENPRARLEELHAIRDPLYREVAHFIIETGKPTVAQLVNMVLMQLEMAGIVAPPAGSSTPSHVYSQS